MIIEKKKTFLKSLQKVLIFIAQDKPSASLNFEKELNKKIGNTINFPYKCRKSYYFEDEDYRDLIYKGYTIIYKIDGQKIKILDIFKWQDK